MNTDTDLGEYEGYPIIDTGVIITNTGDGLSDAMHVEYVYIEAGQEAYIVNRLRKSKDQHEFIRDKESGKILGVKLIQVFKATGGAFSDDKVSKVAVQKMAERVAERKAFEKGQLTLDIIEGDVISIDAPRKARR